MNKKIILVVSLAALVAIAISGILLSGKLFKTNIRDVMSEKRHTIQNQETVEITLSIPKTGLSESIYTAEGQSFSENEFVVYQTDTTSIYIEKIMFSNDSDEHLCFMFNCSYELADSATILVPYKKESSAPDSYSAEIDLVSKTLSDNTTAYPEAVYVTGKGPSEQFVISIPVDVCKKAEGSMNIDVFINQVTYMRTK